MRSLTFKALREQVKLAASLISAKKKIYRNLVSKLEKAGKPTSPYHNKDLEKIGTQIGNLTYDFRHKHIFLSLMRGTPMDKIEKRRACTSKSCEKFSGCCSKPSQKKINELIAYYKPIIESEEAAFQARWEEKMRVE